MKKLLTLLLTLTLLFGTSTLSAFAADTATSPGDASSAAVLTADATRLDVTVPTSVLIHIDAAGNVITPDTIPIINNSAAPIIVSSLAVTAQNGWTLDPASTDYKTFKAGRQNYKMTLNGMDPSAGALSFPTPINGSETMNLALSADVAPQKDAIVASQIGEIVVTVDFYADNVVVPPVGDYVQATDADFVGTTDGGFWYSGTADYVTIPDIIKGIPVTSYKNMFANTSVKGVISTNPNIVSTEQMFANNTAASLELDLSACSSIQNMSGMFQYSAAKTINLSRISVSSTTNLSYMFYNAQVTTLDLSTWNMDNWTDLLWMNNMFNNVAAVTGFARNQADADKFNASSNKPITLIFTVK